MDSATLHALSSFPERLEEFYAPHPATEAYT